MERQCSSCGRILGENEDFCPDCGVSNVKEHQPTNTKDTSRIKAILIAHREKKIKQSVIYAGFWRRGLAFMIDWIVVGVITGLLVILIMIVANKYGYYIDSFKTMNMVVMYPLLFFYFSVHGLLGVATTGKKCMGIKIVDKQVQTVKGLRGFLRTIAYIVSIIPLGAGFIAVAFDNEKQGFHDHFAQTFVIRDEKNS